MLALCGVGIYLLRTPYVTAARAVARPGRASEAEGEASFKLTVDASKIAKVLGVEDEGVAAAQIETVKHAIESADAKVKFSSLSDGKGSSVIDGSIELSQLLGENAEFHIYSDGKYVWTKSGENGWVKSTKSEDDKSVGINQKGAFDFIRSCPIEARGDTITLTMKPRYADIKKMLKQGTIDRINGSLNGSTLETIMDSTSIEIDPTIVENTRLLIPEPYISKAGIKLEGMLSNLVSLSGGAKSNDGMLLDAISYSASGEINIVDRDGITVEKPTNIE